MIGYITVGTNNLSKALAFYDDYPVVIPDLVKPVTTRARSKGFPK